jgi:hypothetical protein
MSDNQDNIQLDTIKKEYWNIDELSEWDKNPRSITEKDFERLKLQLMSLGEYKPMLVNSGKNWGIRGTVLGGNMRLKAYRAIGWNKVWVSVVDPRNEAGALKYALSDNDRAGFYDSDSVANMMPNYPDFDWNVYSIDLSHPMTVNDILNKLEFNPNTEWEGMPEFNQQEQARNHLVILYETEEDLQKLAKLLGQEITPKTKSVWYPARAKQNIIAITYKNET